MIDHVESYLRKKPGPIIAYCYPVCEAILVVLDTIDVFKLYVKETHGITLRDPWYVR